MCVFLKTSTINTKSSSIITRSIFRAWLMILRVQRAGILIHMKLCKPCNTKPVRRKAQQPQSRPRQQRAAQRLLQQLEVQLNRALTRVDTSIRSIHIIVQETFVSLILLQGLMQLKHSNLRWADVCVYRKLVWKVRLLVNYWKEF